MFETSVIRAQAQTARGRVSLLTASVVVHSAVILGALAMSIASVDFPAQSPDEYSRAPVFVPVRIPPPLGNPNGGKQSKAQTAPVKPAPLPTQPVAPTDVPETIPEVPSSGTSESTAAEGTGTGTEPGPVGAPGGVKDSVGDLDAPPVPVDVRVAPPEERIYQPHEVKRAVLLSKVEPRYPPALMKTAMPGTVVVRCVIDKNGNLREPQVLSATMPPFASEVLRVIDDWKYQPATLNGRPVDMYLELTVHFSIRR